MSQKMKLNKKELKVINFENIKQKFDTHFDTQKKD